MITKILQKKMLTIVGFMLTFVGVYFLNKYYPFYVDDWTYLYSYKDQSLIAPADVFKIIESQYTHYMVWGGRCVVHFIAQFMLSLGKFGADILNSLAYTSLIYIICRFARFEKGNIIVLIILANMLIWYLPPDLASTILWKTGSANYLWGILLVLLMMYPYYAYMRSNGDKYAKINLLLIFIAGLLSGGTNENTGVALMFFLFCIILLLRYNKEQVPSWMYVGLVGAIIGCALMILAPGNFKRYTITLDGMSGVEEEPLYRFYFYRSVSIFKNFLMYGLKPALLYLGTLSIFSYLYKGEDKKKLLTLSLLFFATALLAIIVMVAAPIFPERVWFGIIILMVVGLLILLTHIPLTSRTIAISVKTLFTCFTLYFIVSYFATVVDAKYMFGLIEKRAEQILEQKAKGEKIIVLRGFLEGSNSRLIGPRVGDLPLDSTIWIGAAYGKHYGVERIIVIDTLKHE